MFTAFEASKDAQFTSLLTPEFYVFDGGTRFTGQEILSLFKNLRAAGKSYNWNVGEPDVHVVGNTAWGAHVNKGRITDFSGTKEQEWLESAFLEKQGCGGRSPSCTARAFRRQLKTQMEIDAIDFRQR